MHPRDLEQVKEIFQSVRVLPPDQRIAYLNIRCSDNNHLREEIERLLSSYDTEFPETLSGDGPRSSKGARLETGENLGNYRVLQQIGVGGMGEVYLAEDNRLRRKVALKVLPETIAVDDDRLHRFEREAIAASGLNHPNILTIYEFGSQGDIYFLASEYVKGDSVRRRLHKRKLTVAEAINITLQAGAALEAAHQTGIVHRDIKPENIMIRDDGLVKVLDFGLAKYLYAPPLVESEAGDDPTRPKFSTLPGTIMGTVAYMSPEQARGKSVDARSDIWSLGVVLYEMITGRLPFGGETNSDKLASILKSEHVSLTSIWPGIPQDLDRIVGKALKKNVEERYQFIGDMLIDLRMIQGDITGETRKSQVSEVARTADPAAPTEVLGPFPTEDIFQRSKPWWIAAGVVVVLLAAGLAWLRWGGQSAALDERQVSPLTSWKVEIGEDYVVMPRFSPDGKFIAFVSSNHGRQGISLYQIAGGSSLALRENEASPESYPVWSPDGAELAFISDRGGVRGIYAAAALNGPVRLVAPIPAIEQLVCWSKDATKLFFVMKSNLYALEIASRQETRLTNFDEFMPQDRNFALSPLEDRLAYVEYKDNATDLWVSALDGTDAKQLTRDAANDAGPVWHPDGTRIFYSSVRNGISQIVQVFVNGSSQPVQLTSANSDMVVADVALDGSKVIAVGTNDDVDIWRADVESRKVYQATSEMGAEYWPNVSSDGQTIVYQSVPALSNDRILNSAILTRELKSNGQTSRIAANGYLPKWSPAGDELAFLRTENGNNSLWITKPNGEERRLTRENVQWFGYVVLPAGLIFPNDFHWNADGSSLVYSAVREGVSNIWQVAMDGTENQLTNNSDSGTRYFAPLMSADGRRLVWVSTTFTGGSKREWKILTSLDGKVTELYRSAPIVGILGWSSAGNEILLKAMSTSDTRQNIRPSEIDILRVNCENGEVRELGTLRQAYFSTIALSASGVELAVVEREEGTDRLKVATVPSLTRTTLADGAEERVYLSDPSFSPDGRSIVYSKQSRWRVLSLIENLR